MKSLRAQMDATNEDALSIFAHLSEHLSRAKNIMSHASFPFAPIMNPQPEDEWTPRLPTTSTYAWVTSVDQDGSFLVQETLGSPKYRANRARSCQDAIRRGDLVLMVTDGYFHYAICVLHRKPTPTMKLVADASSS